MPDKTRATESPTSKRRVWLALSGAGAAFSVIACSSSHDGSSRPAAFDADLALECVDEDGDGFGDGCSLGQDCDDTDATVGDECWACAQARPGCPCANEGERIVCGKVESEVAGQLVCGLGESVCTDGSWAECIINNSITLAPNGPGTKAQTLGSPGPCKNNPCDPYCQEFIDTPAGVGNPDAGVVATDAGLTLPGSDTSPGGTTCTSGVTGTCAHSICVTGTKLTGGCDVVAQTPVTVWTETFMSNTTGWTLGSEWAIGAATSSSGHQLGNGDPSNDVTPTADKGVAGTVIGGNVSTGVHAWAYLTSPVIDIEDANAPVKLRFSRWLNVDVPANMKATVEVFNGTSWVTLWTNSAAVTDSSWQTIEFDVSAYRSPTFQVRFGLRVDNSSKKVSGWNVDDVKIVGSTAPPGASCVSKICAKSPSCCSGSWSAACVDMIDTECGLECAIAGAACVLCYEDAYDHDGDGFSFQNGDCRDCDPAVNPGAYDFPGNGMDEDCSGAADDEPTSCDAALALASSNPLDYAKAIGLCRQTTANATGKNKKWGVISAQLVQADGSSVPHSLSYGILPQFGPAHLPQEGKTMAAFSSGTARAPGNPGWVNPNGQYGSFDQNKSCNYPAGFPKNAAGCPNGSSVAYDSTGLRMKIRTPSNANSLRYRFDFFSSEYPEWVCTAYNDGFVALLNSAYLPPNDPANSLNISFDSKNNPVSVNVGFFTLVSGPKLAGTGMDGTCQGQICGGGTDWLETTAPVLPRETITIQLSIWDTGDHKWDSIVLIDDWEWSVKPATIQTQPPAPPAVTQYQDGWFVRDYDASGVCKQGESVVWGLWSWTTSTPGDSQIAFTVRTADTKAGLDAAPEDALLFSDPPGPAALDGTPAIAKAGSPNTQGGAAVVDDTLAAKGRKRSSPFLRIVSQLKPSSDKLKAPTLAAWNLQFDCKPSE